MSFNKPQGQSFSQIELDALREYFDPLRKAKREQEAIERAKIAAQEIVKKVGENSGNIQSNQNG